jgi:hypothetical protein
MPKRTPSPKKKTSKVAKKLNPKKLLDADVGGQADADLTMRALSIRQPWAEEIMRGSKTIEYRSRPTKIRGKVYIYAGLGRYTKADDEEIVKEVGYAIDDLERGLIVGTVEIEDCVENKKHGHFEWILKNPRRLKKLLKPTQQPTPAWFYPYQNPTTK